MREKIFNNLSKFVTEKTWWSLILIIIITMITGFFASKLKIEMNMANLLPKDSPMMKEFNYVSENFPGANPMIIVLQGSKEQMIAFAEDLKPAIDTLDSWIEKNASEKVRQQHQAVLGSESDFVGKYYDRVDVKYATEFFEDHGLMMMKSKDLKRSRKLYENPNFLPFLTNLNDNLEREYIQSDEKISTMQKERDAVQLLDNIENWSEDVASGLFNEDYQPETAENAAHAIAVGSPYMISPDRSLMLIMAEPTFNVLDIEKLLPAVNGLEEMVKENAELAGISAGLAGGMTLSRDEMVASTEDSMLLTMLALVGVFILFIVAFRMFTAPFMAVLNLILGIVWAMGITYLIVGSLNMFTAMMSVILVGLGIDFSIHIISVFSEMRKKGEDYSTAMRITFEKVGAGIVTGGMTTAIAFLTLTTGRSSGIIEFGLVTGISVIIVMLGTLLILPTFLITKEKIFRRSKKRDKVADISYRTLGNIGGKVYKNYKIAFLSVLFISIILGFYMGRVEFDYNYLNMEPIGLESVELNDLLIDKYNMSSDPTMMTASTLQENFEFTQKAKEQPSISFVQSITDYMPPVNLQNQRKPLIAEIHANMAKNTVNQNILADAKDKIIDELSRLEANIIEMQDLAFVGGQDMVDQKATRLVGSANLARVLLDMEELIADQSSITEEKVNALKNSLSKILTENYPDSLKKEITFLQSNLTPDISNLEKNYEVLASLANSSAFTGKVTGLINKFLDEELDTEKLRDFCQDFSTHYKKIALNMADTATITLAMLPESTRDQFYSEEEDCYILTVYPKGNVWNIQYLESFSEDLLKITPRIAGMPPMFYYLLNIIGQDGKKAAMLTLLVVFLMLIFDFRSLKMTILAMLPLLVGFVWMLGIMGFLGIKITLVNVMALPLILGIGIDDGIHILHRYKNEGKGSIIKVLSSTGKAIVITSLTTMISFGSLVFATYRGFGSLGIALFIGVGACLLTSVFVLTPVIRLFRE